MSSRRIKKLTTVLGLVVSLVCHASQFSVADAIDDEIAGMLISVSGYGNSQPITGGVVGEDVSRTLIPRILDGHETRPKNDKQCDRKSSSIRFNKKPKRARK